MNYPDSKSQSDGSESEEREDPPVNLRDKPPVDDTGFLIARLKPGVLTGDDTDFGDAARKAGRKDIDEALNAFKLTGRPLITSATAERLRKIEEDAANEKRSALSRRLLSYWRIDTSASSKSLEEIEAVLRRLPDVELVYREKTATDPVVPSDDTHSNRERFLNAKPAGVNARWVWTQPSGDGSNMHFIDLEQGWILDHEDLLLPDATVICNENHDGHDGFIGNHGTAVLGIVAGRDNGHGIIGIAPNLASVRVVSRWDKEDPDPVKIADAVTAATLVDPLPHVLLIEAQLGALKLPAETDPGVFDAISLAVDSGIIVVAAAGNGDQDLDEWTNTAGEHLLNRDSPEGRDSGAILVGAGRARVPHHRSLWTGGQGSNFGSRVDCYAWGNNITTSGYGSLGGFATNSYESNFGGTSGAAAIIAGCALLLQGLHFANLGSLLSPNDMRSLLSDEETGTPQGGAVPGNIGIMPDLREVVEKAFSV